MAAWGVAAAPLEVELTGATVAVTRGTPGRKLGIVDPNPLYQEAGFGVGAG